MYVQKDYVQLIGFGGATVLTLEERLTNINLKKHLKVILQIGGNDLCTTSADEVNYLKCKKIKMYVQKDYVQLIGFGGATV